MGSRLRSTTSPTTPARARATGAARRCGTGCSSTARSSPPKGSGIKTKQLKTTKRKNGSLQVTYYGQPLYRYHKDTKTGQRAGASSYQFGGSWGLIGVNGSPLTSGHY